MVIQCPECQARFKMADEKAKNGVKVRCSRCQSVFPVQVPEVAVPAAPPVAPPLQQETATTEADTSLFAAAASAAPSTAAAPADSFSSAEPAAMPSPSQGLGDFDLADFSIDTGPSDAGGSDIDELDLGHFNMEAAAQLASEGGSTDDFNFDESPATEFSFGAAEENTGFDFTDSPVASDFSFDEAAAGDDFSFAENSADNFSPIDFGDSEPDGMTADQSAFSTTDGDAFSFDSISPESAFAIDPPQPAPAEKAETTWSSGDGPNDEFEFSASTPATATEDFDFSNLTFGDDSPAAPSAPPLSPAVSEVLPPLVAASPAPLPVKEERAAAAATRSPEEDEPIFVPPPKRRKPALGRSIGILVVLLLLGGGAGYYFLQGGIADGPSLLANFSGNRPQPKPAGQIRVVDLNGYFVNNAEAGQLFVIHGRVVNDFPEARSAIAVKGILYDQGGKALIQQTVFTGNMLDESVLRSLPFAKIQESMNNQFGDSLSNLNVAPGKSLPFTIVFRNLPTGLAEFTAEVTDSKPGAG